MWVDIADSLTTTDDSLSNAVVLVASYSLDILFPWHLYSYYYFIFTCLPTQFVQFKQKV